jgi:hypothetical protein
MAVGTFERCEEQFGGDAERVSEGREVVDVHAALHVLDPADCVVVDKSFGGGDALAEFS